MHKFLANSYTIIFIVLFWVATLMQGFIPLVGFIMYQDKALFREVQFIVTDAAYEVTYDSDKDIVVEKYLVGEINKVKKNFYHSKGLEDCNSKEAILQKFKIGMVLDVLYNDDESTATGKRKRLSVVDISHNFEKDWDSIVFWAKFFLLPSVIFFILVIVWGKEPPEAESEDPSEFKRFNWRRPRFKFRRKSRK